MRLVLAAAAVAGLAACSIVNPPPGHLRLSNFRFDHAAIEAVVTAAPDCSGGMPVAFDLPFKGTRVIDAAPEADICWRRQAAGGPWTEWNRAYTATGRSVDSQL